MPAYNNVKQDISYTYSKCCLFAKLVINFLNLYLVFTLCYCIYTLQSLSNKIAYIFNLIVPHTLLFQTASIILSLLDFTDLPINKNVKTSLKRHHLQHSYHSPTDSKDPGSKVISPAVVNYAVTHCFSPHGRQSGQATEQDPPCTLLGDNPAGQVAVKTGAQ